MLLPTEDVAHVRDEFDHPTPFFVLFRKPIESCDKRFRAGLRGFRFLFHTLFLRDALRLQCIGAQLLVIYLLLFWMN